MTAELSNAASERLIAEFAYLNQQGLAGWDPRSRMADDFYYEDRRRLSVFGHVDAEGLEAFVATLFQVGAGTPQIRVSSVLSARGDRFAVCPYRLVYGNDMETEGLFLVGVDATLTRAEVLIDFDVDDLDGAIAELDRLHRQTEAL